MNKPLVSIIVTVFNVETWLRNCLDSILQLKGFSWEAIIIDDGSTDKSPLICDEYKRICERIQVIHQENQGVSMARNRGINNAKGEWIWFVDSDDIICQPQNIKDLESIEADYIMFDGSKFVDGEEMPNVFVEHTIFCDDGKDKNIFLKRNICFYHCQLWYKKQLIDNYQLRFTPGVNVGEDGEFQNKYLMICQHPVYFRECLYLYRIRKNSLSHNNYACIAKAKSTFLILQRYLAFMGEHKIRLEEWLLIRLEITIKLYLYTARLAGMDFSVINKNYHRIIDIFAKSGYNLLQHMPYILAYHNLKMYYILQKLKNMLKCK